MLAIPYITVWRSLHVAFFQELDGDMCMSIAAHILTVP
ncbi:hypothetical protein APHCR_0382 [Anaplasma phagocytophilum str. CR1007]|nr:hypothetical protein APHCR_0382 [Anaplasma phagocytophilum str. CR1007]KKA00457.1 hypothetical protein APHDU1_0181 [Anaplasma phagocytophilum]